MGFPPLGGLRWTLLVPGDPERAPIASVWAVLQRHGRPPIVLRDDRPLASFGAAKTGITIGPCRLGPKDTKGSVGDSATGLALSWDLKWGPPGVAWQHFHPALKESGIAKSCLNSPRLATSLTGSVTIRDADGAEETLELAAVPAEQTHLWGRSPTRHYAWAHGNAFKDRPDVVFEGLSARIAKGPLLLPAAGPLLLVTERHRFELNGLLAMYGVRSEQDSGRWTFEAEAGGLLLRGEIHAPLDRVVALEYADPASRATNWCQNTLRADARIRLYAPSGTRWRCVEDLHAERSMAFEITRPTLDPRVTHSAPWSAGRAVPEGE